ncbi:hypothetical protein [Hyphomicrobium sp. DMF-1]|uniref:hypothetical protein n=1 Tax=Hyphomicrobium sp. DMF-1 TaxID=3019544 RepID=UPI0022EBB413|nr:hypothetical protein [Hyphomicrobium sp. DMF-1]WBT40123.1 hypothetical protein PE058_09645 [Hyphomicrobium sp. DMF-1]
MGDTQEIDALEEIDAAIADAECEQMEQDIIATLQLAKAEITRLRSELTMWHGKVGEFAKAFEAQRSELERARADLERAYEKDDVKTREINILTRENRNLYERLASSQVPEQKD